MKNKLAENFLRFAPKNLTESTRSKLVTLIKEGADLIAAGATMEASYKDIVTMVPEFKNIIDVVNTSVGRMGTAPDGNPLFYKFDPSPNETNTGQFTFYKLIKANGFPVLTNVGAFTKRDSGSRYISGNLNDAKNEGIITRGFGNGETGRGISEAQKQYNKTGRPMGWFAAAYNDMNDALYTAIAELVQSDVNTYKQNFIDHWKEYIDRVGDNWPKQVVDSLGNGSKSKKLYDLFGYTPAKG